MTTDDDRKRTDPGADDATEIVPLRPDPDSGGDAPRASAGAAAPDVGERTEYPFDRDPDATEMNDPAATEVQPPIGMQPSQVIRPSAEGRSGATPLVRWLAVAAVLIAATLAVLVLVDRWDFAPKETRTGAAAVAPALAVVEAALADGDVDDLPARLLTAVRDHPQSPELAGLLAEANRYVDLLELRETGRSLDLAQRRGEGAFATPALEAAAARELDPAIPPPDVVERMALAENAWERGELVAALDGLRALREGPGGEWGERRLQHYTRVVEAYDQLASSMGSPDYPQRLLAFYLGLDPLRDRFFWVRLARDFEPVQDQMGAAEGQLESAARAWGNYWHGGGISPTMRQQATSEALFSRLAAELTDTRRYLSVVEARAAQLGGADKEYLFPSQVDAEIERQRRRLRTLLAHHDDPVLVERLQQLPSAE